MITLTDTEHGAIFAGDDGRYYVQFVSLGSREIECWPFDSYDAALAAWQFWAREDYACE